MSQAGKGQLPAILAKNEAALLAEWIKEQLGATGTQRGSLLKESELREQCREFLALVAAAVQTGSLENLDGPAWTATRTFLTGLSRSRAILGFNPSETASFVFSLKRPLFAVIRRELGQDPQAVIDETLRSSELLDKLGLYTTEVHQKAREEVIVRQQQEMLELSTPVVTLWDGILALPMIGTLDSSRTQVVMETLLEKIVQTRSAIAIIDITGVPTVDTLTAQHLLKTVTAARLMGAECLISGIRPQIAQTIVHLGVELGSVITKATLADAFAIALERSGRAVTRTTPRA